MAGKETSVQNEYVFSRSFRDSARLQYLHYIWKERLGYLLHPSIPISAPDCKVADVGTGNACWLLDLARSVPSTWSLQGFDISTSQWPAKVRLPENVSLETLDAFGDIPHALIGKFDIVHLRLFSVVVKGGNPDPLIKNLVKLLKPGGFLQWDEGDANSFAPFAPTPSISHEYTDEFIRLWFLFLSKRDIKLGWMLEIPQHLSREGLEIVHSKRFGPTDELLKPATDCWMMALEEAGFGRGEAGSQITREEFSALFEKVTVETQSGIGLWLDMMVIVGRK